MRIPDEQGPAIPCSGRAWALLCLGGPTRGQTAQPGPARLLPAPVPSVTVVANGARSDGVSGEETARICSNFRLSQREVRSFFATAQPVDARAYHHDLLMSRCHAVGLARFRNGTLGQGGSTRSGAA